MTTSLPRIPRSEEMNHPLLPEELQYNGYFQMRVAAKNIGNQSKIYYALSGVKSSGVKKPPKLLKGIDHFKRKLEDLEDIYKKMEHIQKINKYKIVPYTEPAQEFDRYYKEGDKLKTHLDTVYTEMCKRYSALRNICSSIEFAKRRESDIGAEIYRNQRDKRQTEIDKRRGTTKNRADSAMQPGEAPPTDDAAKQESKFFGWPSLPSLFAKGKKSKKSKKTSKKTSKKSKTHKRKMH